MALPKVTPGTYDYGAYANPTAVRYRGGQEAIGAAIGGAIETGVRSFTEAAAEIKKDKSAVTDYKVRLTDQIDPKIKAQSIETIKSHVNEMGELEYMRRRGKISDDEYFEKKSILDTEFQFLKSLPTLAENALDGEINMNDYKGQDRDRNAGLHRALSSGNLKLEKASDGRLSAKWSGIDGKEYSSTLSDLVTNVDKFLDLKQKFNFGDLETQKQLAAVASSVNSSKDIKRYMTDVESNASGKFEALNIEQATKGISESSFIDGFVNAYGKDIFEDVIEPSLSAGMAGGAKISYESPEAQAMIRQIVAAQVASKVQQTGNSIPEEKQQPVAGPPEPTGSQKIIEIVNSGEADKNIKELYSLTYGRDMVENKGNYIYMYDSQEQKDKGEYAQRVDVTDPLDMATALARVIYPTDSKYGEAKLDFIQPGVFSDFYLTPTQKKVRATGLKTN